MHGNGVVVAHTGRRVHAVGVRRRVHRWDQRIRRLRRLYGTLIGIAIVGMIEAGIVSSGLSGFWTRAVHGMVIVVAVSSYAILSGNADERILRLVRWRKR